MRSLAFVLLIIVPLTADASAADEGIEGELTPYGWFNGIDGTVTIAGRRASFDQSFSDLVDHVDGAFMGLGVVRWRRFVVFGQYDYTDLGADGQTVSDTGPSPLPPGTPIDGNLETDITTFAGGYRFGDADHHAVDVLFGVRDMEMDLELRAGDGSRFENAGVTDTIVMIRPSVRLTERWHFNPTMSYAIAGDSDTHYELQPQLQYRISDAFAARIGYRRLHYEVSAGTEGTLGYREFDGDLSGFLLGFGWVFYSR